MANPSEHAVHVLNDLISLTLDSANGYKEAADNTESSQFKSMFQMRSQRRYELTRELQEEVRSFGGKPEDDQSLMGKMHNKFVDVKAALTGHDDKAVINEVERGEDHIKHKYETALQEQDLSSETRDVINRAYESVRRGHDQVRDLKHALEGAE